jgi:hypothetical protein
MTEADFMKKIIKIAFSATLFLTTAVALACDYPERPHMPDGSAASKEELLVAKSDVQNFIASVDEYLQCVEAEEKAAIAEMDDPSTEELQPRDEMLTKKFDAANEEKALVGEQFNQQVRAYNQKLKDSKQ